MRKEDYIKKYGIEGWEHHLAISREWNKKNKQKHINATIECRRKKPEYYKAKSDENNIKYAELKKQWKQKHSIKDNYKNRPILKHLKTTLTRKFKKYCCDALCQIENYYIALQDNFEGWCIHHRLELHPDGSVRYTANSLKKLNLYYNRPFNELIFLRNDEHSSIHTKNVLFDGISKRKSKYVDTSLITVNSSDNIKEYLRQYNHLRWKEEKHG